MTAVLEILDSKVYIYHDFKDRVNIPILKNTNRDVSFETRAQYEESEGIKNLQNIWFGIARFPFSENFKYFLFALNIYTPVHAIDYSNNERLIVDEEFLNKLDVTKYYFVMDLTEGVYHLLYVLFNFSHLFTVYGENNLFYVCPMLFSWQIDDDKKYKYSPMTNIVHSERKIETFDDVTKLMNEHIKLK